MAKSVLKESHCDILGTGNEEIPVDATFPVADSASNYVPSVPEFLSCCVVNDSHSEHLD
jgi:hypothetical protein